MKSVVKISLEGLEAKIRQKVEDEVIPSMVKDIKIMASEVVDEKFKTARVKKSIVSDVEARYKRSTSEIVIETEGIADLFDTGWDRFDMKPGFLASPKAKISKEGKRYIDIPLVMSSASDMAQISQKATAMSSSHLGVRGVTEEAESKSTFWAKKVLATGKRNVRGFFKRMEGRFSTGKHTGKHHKVDERIEFRRVSANSKPNSWVNKGRGPSNISEGIGYMLEDRIKERIREERGVLGGMKKAFRDVLRILMD